VLEALDLALLDAEVAFAAGIGSGLFERVLRVVAGIGSDLGAGADLPDVANFDDVEEVAVVGDDDDGALEGGNHALKGDLAGHVEVVVGLVQEQRVWVCDEDLGHADLFLLSTAERGHGQVEQFVRDAEGTQGAFGPALEIGSAAVIELGQLGGVVFHYLGEGFGVVVDVWVTHAAFEFGEFPFEGGKLQVSGQHFVQRGGFTVEHGLLGQVANGGAGEAIDGAAVRLLRAKDDVEQGGFAGTVGANGAHVGALWHLP